MLHRASSDDAAIRQVVQQIHECWLSQRFEEIGELLSEHVVMAMPGFDGRIRGRAEYVQSYRDYDRVAKTSKFTPEEPEIDVVGDVAVAVCPFSVSYELEGKPFHETGRDVLVLVRAEGRWRVAWRTMQTEPAGQGSG